MKPARLPSLLCIGAAMVALALVLAAWHDPHFVRELANQLWACF